MFVEPPALMFYIMDSYFCLLLVVIGWRPTNTLQSLLNSTKESRSIGFNSFTKNERVSLTNLIFSPLILPEVSMEIIRSIPYLLSSISISSVCKEIKTGIFWISFLYWILLYLDFISKETTFE